MLLVGAWADSALILSRRNDPRVQGVEAEGARTGAPLCPPPGCRGPGSEWLLAAAKSEEIWNNLVLSCLDLDFQDVTSPGASQDSLIV